MSQGMIPKVVLWSPCECAQMYLCTLPYRCIILWEKLVKIVRETEANRQKKFQGIHKLAKNWEKQKLSPSAVREYGPANTLASDFHSHNETIHCYLEPPVCGTLSWQPWEPSHLISTATSKNSRLLLYFKMFCLIYYTSQKSSISFDSISALFVFCSIDVFCCFWLNSFFLEVVSLWRDKWCICLFPLRLYPYCVFLLSLIC